MNIEREITNLKRTIKDYREKLLSLEIELKNNQKQLKELGFKDINQAKNKEEKLDKEIEKLEDILTKKLEEIQQKYNL